MRKKTETFDQAALLDELGREQLREFLRQMLLIRQFELRGEAAYQQGKVGGFFHSYIGQEAIQIAAVAAIGKESYWTTTYRCHALALLLREEPREMMAELYGRSTGNAKGRGGSMHLFSDHMLGGFGIVGGHIPIATGAGFTLKYKGIKDRVSVCFMGDGAVAQGAFHESLNLAALWHLPVIYVIENNHWGMGTAVEKAISVPRLAEDKAPGYGIKAMTLDGMDFFACYAGFRQAFQQVLKEGKPLLIECVTERFKGHSISDPGLYRNKEQLKTLMERDPIILLRDAMEQKGWMSEEEFQALDKEQRERMIDAMKFAEESPWPNPATLEQDVFAAKGDSL